MKNRKVPTTQDPFEPLSVGPQVHVRMPRYTQRMNKALIRSFFGELVHLILVLPGRDINASCATVQVTCQLHRHANTEEMATAPSHAGWLWAAGLLSRKACLNALLACS